MPEYFFKPLRHKKRLIPKNMRNQPAIDKNPLVKSTGSPTKIFAGKLIIQGKGVHITMFLIFSGKTFKGAINPDKNTKNNNHKLSKAAALSVQNANIAKVY